MAPLGRPRMFDRDAALQAAMLLFWRKGFAATSMAELYEAMNIRSPSLYAAFGCKEALYREAIGHYVKTLGPGLWDRLACGASAREGVENLLLTAAANLPESGGSPAGCMAMLAAVGDEWPASIEEDVKNLRLEALRRFRVRLAAGAAAGELAPADADRLSRFYLGIFQGMAIQARDGATSAELQTIAEAAMAAWPGP